MFQPRSDSLGKYYTHVLSFHSTRHDQDSPKAREFLQGGVLAPLPLNHIEMNTVNATLNP